MKIKAVGILHPGAMGSSIGEAARAGGLGVYWVSMERSHATKERAQKAGLIDAGTLKTLVDRCGLIVSVCPPASAQGVADAVAGFSYSGFYLDANAICPDSSRQIARRMESTGARFIDGGIIGPPAWKEGTTRLYLSGPGAGEVAAIFSGSPLEVIELRGPAGRASALKMTYAAYTKGTVALLGAILAVAEHEGVREALQREWSLSQPALADSAVLTVQRTTAKAWRFAGEMREIAAAFESANLPGGFHKAAEEVYSRQDFFKGYREPPLLEEVLKALLLQD